MPVSLTSTIQLFMCSTVDPGVDEYLIHVTRAAEYPCALIIHSWKK